MKPKQHFLIGSVRQFQDGEDRGGGSQGLGSRREVTDRSSLGAASTQPISIFYPDRVTLRKS